MSAPVYLDHAATTPLDPTVEAAMAPYWRARFGNPHSADHPHGWAAEEAVEAARGQVATLAGFAPAEIVFTSGATEANNLALLGLAPHLRRIGRTHLLASPLEHPCVTACLERLAAEGFAVETLPIGASGVIDPADVARAIMPRTGLVTLTAASHEIGTLQPLAEVAAITRPAGVLLHGDAAQAAGKVPMELGPDLLTLSAHKLYGPMGIGALAVRRALHGMLEPRMLGGGQQGGLRSGTIPTPLAAGFGAAAAIARAGMAEEGPRLAGLRDQLWHGLEPLGATRHGDPECCLPGFLSIHFGTSDAAGLLARLRDRVSVSLGAACASAIRRPSPSLLAIGLSETEALATLRLSLGRFTTADEITMAIAAFRQAVLESF